MPVPMNVYNENRVFYVYTLLNWEKKEIEKESDERTEKREKDEKKMRRKKKDRESNR